MERRSFAERIPAVGALAAFFSRLAGLRYGRIPVGLLSLLPVAIFLDAFDVADELAGGPIGMGLSFVLESAFLLAITGRPTRAFGFAGIDLIPFVDVIPFATIALVREIVRAWQTPVEQKVPRSDGPIIDV